MTRESILAVILIAEQTGVPARDILSRDRSRKVSHARQDAWRVIRDELGYSYPRIGQIFGRDHTTILYGIEQSRRRAGK